MAEYKESEALIEKLETLLSDFRFIVKYERQHGSISDVEKSKAKLETMKDVISLVKSQPTSDVQEVVRCKDCNYFSQTTVDKKGFCICSVSGMEITDNDFCSYGEKNG